jgi:exodeoxyribonuclease V gamma subunit
MFYLHTSNQTERLSEQLARVIAERQTASLYSREVFLIQSPGMERMLSQYLADFFGVWCHAAYFLPGTFIDYLTEAITKRAVPRSFDRDVLTWRIERILRNVSDPQFKVLAEYLSAEPIALKRFQFARQLAILFDQYQVMRPDYLDSWLQGKTITHDQSEQWQQLLWIKLCEDRPGELHRGERIREIVSVLYSDAELCEMLPRRLYVFGVHTMSPLFLSALAALADRIDVHLFLLSPCELYWGDIESRRSLVRRKLKRIDSGSYRETEESSYHPLLASLGQQGAHFQEMLLGTIDYSEGSESFVSPVIEGDASLLHMLQEDILRGRQEPHADQKSVTKMDNSLTMVSCHSRMREIMVLKDYLLSWLYTDPSLQLHDIVVMAPDIQQYSQLIPPIFEDLHYTISDRYSRHRNGYLDTFLQLLDLASSRYGWSDLMSFLERPQVYPRYGMTIADCDQVKNWVVAAGIRSGISAEQRQNDGLYASGAGTWRAGLNRMLMGVAIDSSEAIDTILPFAEIEGNQIEVLGWLCQFIDDVEQAFADFKISRTLKNWSELFKELCGRLFADQENPELLELYRFIAELGDELSVFHDETVTFDVVKSWLRTTAEASNAAGFLNGRLTFCSMLPMRSVPFRVICLLGINEGEYPKNDNYNPFDLIGKQYRLGDRSKRSDDRYQFLEAITAARDKFYISYTGQSIKTNKKTPPSVVVTELIETLSDFYGVTDCVVHHPLQPYSASYFDGSKNLFSFDEHYCRVASALQLESKNRETLWFSGPAASKTRPEVDLLDLAAFLVHPQAYFVRRIMEIDLRSTIQLPDDHEPFEIPRLDHYLIDQAVIEALREQKDKENILNALQAESRWPLGVPGRLQFDGRLEDLMIFADNVASRNMGDLLSEPTINLDVEGVRLKGGLKNCFENGLLFYRYANLKGRDVLLAYLYHLIAGQIPNLKQETHIIARDRLLTFKADLDHSDDLAFLVHLYLQGCQIPSSLHVEPAFAYAKQVISNRGRGRKSPLEVARKLLHNQIEKGYAAESALLYQDLGVEKILDSCFETLCEDFVVPLWDYALNCSEEV